MGESLIRRTRIAENPSIMYQNLLLYTLNTFKTKPNQTKPKNYPNMFMGEGGQAAIQEAEFEENKQQQKYLSKLLPPPSLPQG